MKHVCLVAVGLLVVLLFGCGVRRAKVFVADPQGPAVKTCDENGCRVTHGWVTEVETYNTTSESAAGVSDASTRLMAVRACTTDPALKQTEGCQKLLALQVPADHPAAPFNRNIAESGRVGRGAYYRRPYDHCWYCDF